MEETYMTIATVAELLNARILTGEVHSGLEVTSAFACDLMSDVLAYANGYKLLLSGLCNAQVIRTAEMLDMNCIIFVRGKCPDEQMIEMAASNDMVVLRTDYSMFTSSGILYQAGIKGGQM